MIRYLFTYYTTMAIKIQQIFFIYPAVNFFLAFW